MTWQEQKISPFPGSPSTKLGTLSQAIVSPSPLDGSHYHPDHASLLLLVSNGHEFPVSRPQLLQLVNGVPQGPTPFSQFSLFASVCFFASAWPFHIGVQFLVVVSIKNQYLQ